MGKSVAHVPHGAQVSVMTTMDDHAARISTATKELRQLHEARRNAFITAQQCATDGGSQAYLDQAAALDLKIAAKSDEINSLQGTQTRAAP